jgi:methyl-accepting chemotaxis protein
MLEVRDNVRTLQNKIESSERRLIYVHQNTEEMSLSVKQIQNVFQILERLTNNLELLSQYLNNYSESVESMKTISISTVSVVEKKLENVVDSLEMLKSEINRKLELVERIEKKIPNVSRLDYYEESVKDVNSTMMYLKDVLNRIPKKQEFNELKNGLNTLKEKIDEIEKLIKKPKIVSKVKKLKVRKQPRKK